REMLAAFRAASIAQSKINAPVVKRQRELIEKLQDLLKNCSPGGAKAGCENAESERNAISRELGELSAQASKGAAQITDLSQRMSAAERRLPGYEEFSSGRAARLAESERLETELRRMRGQIVERFPDYLSLAEPAPLTVAETQKLLQEDEALIAIL